MRRAVDPLRVMVTLAEDAPLGERFGLATVPAVSARFFLAVVTADLGEFAEAIAAGEEGLEIAQTRGHAFSEAWARYFLGYLSLPRTTDGVPLLEEAEDAFAGLANVMGPAFITLLTEPYLVLGRIAKARDLAEQAVALARARRGPSWEAWGLKLRGDVHAHDEAESEQAGGCYRQSLALAIELGMRPLVAHCHFGFAKLYRQTDRREQAREHLTTATTMYREMDMQFWLEQAQDKMKELT